MFKTVEETLETLQEDKSISDVLSTVGAAITSLTGADFSMEIAILISVVLKKAEKRINQITQSKQ